MAKVSIRGSSRAQQSVNCMQVLHSLSKERLELVNSLEPYVTERVVPLLKPVEKCWQPADFLPDPSKGDYLDQVSSRTYITLNT